MREPLSRNPDVAMRKQMQARGLNSILHVSNHDDARGTDGVNGVELRISIHCSSLYDDSLSAPIARATEVSSHEDRSCRRSQTDARGLFEDQGRRGTRA